MEFFAPAAPLMKHMPIYTAPGNHEGALQCNAIDLDGRLFDQFEIRKTK